MTVTIINGCVFFPHANAWQAAVSGRRAWQTEVADSLPGAESRQALRAVARRQHTVTIGALSPQERVRFEARVDAALKSGYGALPLFGRCSFLSAAAASGAGAITVTTDSWHWQAGDYAALLFDDETFDVQAVTNVAGGVLTLAGPLGFAWANGAIVRPVIFGMFTAQKEMPSNPATAAWTVSVAELTSSRAAQIGATPASVPGVGQQVIGSTNVIA
ncbi:MAG: hypothetical protein KGL39_54015 [Patescibacteria group bacterium]|nr:hypothetical protein [Patescibacteria group bacterium]